MRLTSYMAAALAILAPSGAYAASAQAPTGVGAGFYDLQTSLNTILTGDGGFAIIIMGAIAAAISMIVLNNMRVAIGAIFGAMFLGYGVPVLAAFAGVSADIDMIDVAALSGLEPPVIAVLGE